ncbi:MAG: MlaD family protein [Spirochaetaceae bacterium]
MSRLAKVGLFFLVIGVSSVSYILMTVDNIAGGDAYTITVFMDDASGLIVDSGVRMAGVDVGQIRRIELVEGKAKLTLEIREDVRIYEDAVISKQPSSLLGTSVVSIDPGERTGGLVQQGETIRNVQSTGDFGGALSSMQDVGDEAALFIRELREQFATEGTYGDLNEIIENVRLASDSTRILLEQNLQLLSSTLTSIERVVQQVNSRSDAELDRVSMILENTAAITARIEALLAENDEQIAASLTEVQTSLASLNRTLQTVEGSALDVKDATGQIRSGEGTVGKIVYDDELYERVNSIATGAEEIVNRLSGLGIQVGYEGSYLAQAGDARNDFHLRLLPRINEQSQAHPQKYYELGLVDTPAGVTRTTTTVVDQDASGEFDAGSYRRVEEETRDELKFNALLARRYGPVTLRGGVIESTGGFGVDLTPAEQVQISAEMFDFGDETPNLRTYGTLFPFYQPERNNPLNWVFLSGGVEETLTDERDYFFGGGLRFTDQDLQGLVGLVPFGAQ